MRQLDAIERRFNELSKAFTPPPPSSLTFQTSASSNAPKLDYTSTNAPVHGYEDALTKLLMELDGVESGGDIDVRTRRKELVKRVEGEAQRVETWRRDCFEARQKGEEGPEWSAMAARQGEENADSGQADAGQDRDEDGDVQDEEETAAANEEGERNESVATDGEEADEGALS